MPIPSYNYSMEIVGDLSLTYHNRDVLDELYPTNTKYFLDPLANQILPAGRYRLYYKSGAIRYSSDAGWNVNKQPRVAGAFPTTTFTKATIGSGYDTHDICYFTDIVNDYEVGFVVCYSGGKELCTGNYTQYTYDYECVDANLSVIDYTEFDHAGGPIGVYFHATSPSISSSSSYSPTDAEASSTYGQPKFILVRLDDPTEYQCDTEFNIMHKGTRTVHVKRPGNGTSTFSAITITGNVNSATTGKIKIESEGPPGSNPTIIKNWTNITSFPVSFNTDILPDVGLTGYSIDSEKLIIYADLTSGFDYTILNWDITIGCIGVPTVTAPTVTEAPPSNSDTNIVHVEWNKVVNSINGIVYGYDVYIKEWPDASHTSLDFTDSDIVSTVLQPGGLVAEYDMILTPGKRYIWGVRTVVSNGYSDITTEVDFTFTISDAAVADSYVRIKPVSNIIRNQVKVQWNNYSDVVKKFKIYRGVSYYDINGNSIFDWVPICEWDKDTNTSYYIVFDISKNYNETYITDYSVTTPNNYVPGLSIQNFTGLSTEIIRNIQLQLEHYELWFKIEAITDKVVKGDLRYIVLGGSSIDTNTNGAISCISTKTQYLDYLVDNPIYPSESPIKQELELIWVTRKLGTDLSSDWSDVSRTAMDIKSLTYGREISAWTTCRGTGGNGACSRFNLKTGQPQQTFIKFNTSPAPFGTKPRGTVLEPVSGDCFVCGGPDDGTSNTRIAHLFYKECGTITYTITSGSITSASINTPGTSGYTDGSYTQSVPGGTGGIINYTVVGGVLSSASINSPGSGYVDGTRQIAINYPVVQMNVADPSKFVSLSLPHVTRNYGSTLDKFGRIWYSDGMDLVVCVSDIQGVSSAVTFSIGGGYGICTDFYGNIWVTGWSSSIPTLTLFKINDITGVISPKQSININANSMHGGACADIPSAIDGTYNIWTGRYQNPNLYKYKFQHYDDGSGNHTVSYISQTTIDLSSLISGGFIHGTAFTSENDIIATTHQKPYVFKIYQKENNNSWPNGGLFRYNDKQLISGSKTLTTGTRYYQVPLGVRYEDDMEHPMWHECFDNYDNNFSYTISQLSRYKAWKILCGFSGPDVLGGTLVNTTPFNTSWKTDYPLRMFPHYGGTAGAVSDNPLYPGICDGPGYNIQCAIIDGYSVARYKYSTNAKLVETPTGSVLDLSTWALYVYSDFVGGVGMFSYGNYPISDVSVKYPPTIGSCS